MVARYRFTGVITNKRSVDVLQELRSVSNKVVGVTIFYTDRSVEVDFSEEPTKEELDSIKQSLSATSYEKVEGTTEESW